MGYFARVCVDVDLSADRVEEILIEREQVGSKDIYLFKQVMIYEKPTERCGYCTKYGHMIAGCLKRKDDEGKKTKIIIKDLVEGNLAAADVAAQNAHNVDCNIVGENSVAAANNEVYGMNKKGIVDGTAVSMLAS
ncbi:hypothetical protein AMTR_s00034p00211880 [Amborella trichopoda]|uniref:Zinc knuckle CX2CX4HX4C domain-containing protein n=1 Tax=Amborella trichopoda TaxID=13333 RepID=W1PQD2_AMBTC|nr:hypothetical protein AMTR_s00034p00211880 [Amborella trichopoda]